MPNFTAKQPPPVPSSSPAVWPLIIADIREGLEAPRWLKDALVSDMQARDDFGRSKYGVPLTVENGRDAGADAYQEALDLCVYARQKAEQTSSPMWSTVAGKAIGLAAAIRFQLAVEREESA